MDKDKMTEEEVKDIANILALESLALVSEPTLYLWEEIEDEPPIEYLLSKEEENKLLLKVNKEVNDFISSLIDDQKRGLIR